MKSKIEAILFASGEPVEVANLAKFLKISNKELEEYFSELDSFYKDNESGLQLIRKGSKIQLASNEKQGELVAKFLNKKLHEPLSKAALEVLAVVAYRGPVTRAQIEHIRGVNCSFSLRNLAIKGLIERKDNPADSRSYVYETSFDLLKSLGISEVEKLPNYENLNGQEIPGEKKEETESDNNKKEE